MSSIEIRALAPSELPQTFGIGHRFTEAAEVYGGFDEEEFQALWTLLIENGEGVLLAALDGERILGVIGGLVVPDIVNGIPFGQECFWWVEPRNGKVALQLFFAFREWASQRGAKILRMGSRETLEPERLDKLYSCLGFRKIEVHYEMEL